MLYRGLAVLLTALAGMVAIVPGSAQAQAIVVNGASCPAASVQFSLAGMVAILPVGCSGNGNPCDSALVTFSSAGISIQAPPACLTAPSVPSPMALQSVLVNGNTCNGATVTHSVAGIAIDAPPSCLAATALLPAISQISPAAAHAGQSVTITGSNFFAGASVTVGGIAANVLASTGTTSLTIGIPTIGLGMQPVIVTSAGLSSAVFQMNIIAVPVPVKLLSVKSRKTHGAAGAFDIAIDATTAIGGNVTVEPRSIGTGHTIVFQFDGTITSAGIVTAVDLMGVTVSANVLASSGNHIFVSLPDVADNRRVTISLAGINGVSSALTSIGFLLGDINNTRAVDAADLAAVKAYSGQASDATNFRYDLKASGRINAADIATIKARQGVALAP